MSLNGNRNRSCIQIIFFDISGNFEILVFDISRVDRTSFSIYFVVLFIKIPLRNFCRE